MFKLLVGNKQKNKLRNNVKVSNLIDRQVSHPKPHKDKIDNIHHEDKLYQNNKYSGHDQTKKKF